MNTTFLKPASALGASLLLTLLLLPSARSGAAEPPATPPLRTYGVGELLQQTNKPFGQKLVLEGFVTDYCKHRGCWAMLHDNDSDSKSQLRVKQDEAAPDFKPFLAELQGRTLRVTGELHQTRIDADYLDQWEARVKAAQAKASKTQTNSASEAVLRQIAEYRQRVAKSKQGHLVALSFAVETWETKPQQP